MGHKITLLKMFRLLFKACNECSIFCSVAVDFHVYKKGRYGTLVCVIQLVHVKYMAVCLSSLRECLMYNLEPMKNFNSYFH